MAFSLPVEASPSSEQVQELCAARPSDVERRPLAFFQACRDGLQGGGG